MTDNCDEALHDVYLYLDRELTWWRRRQIRRHLNGCPPCEHGYEFEQRLKVVIKTRLAEEVPSEFIDRLNAAIRAEQGPGGGC